MPAKHAKQRSPIRITGNTVEHAHSYWVSPTRRRGAAASRRERTQELFVAEGGVGDVAGVQARPLADTGFEILDRQRLGLHV